MAADGWTRERLVALTPADDAVPITALWPRDQLVEACPIAAQLGPTTTAASIAATESYLHGPGLHLGHQAATVPAPAIASTL
jgi:hypothetical protein